ncbi:diguanylate cyclase [Neobacillus piezotolerans]|uniref:Diguanylate cyclase n=1 Tax=Neobacillus piezotolerans TaxID=2259171 RepID=A0A3D8GPM0_9BACI|nr:ABC transporter permease [Neobacillus piezotolerans]RDU36016.1 diguanylate cyclase [Neobacillus piezotolerans]
MWKYIIRRSLQAIPLLIIISIITFLLMTLAPGSPLDMYRSSEGADAVDTTAIEAKLGLDQPLYVQYFKWMQLLVLEGNLGYSFEDGRPVTEKILERVPATMLLMGVSIVISFILAIPIGVYSAVKKYSLFDNFFTTFTYVGVAVPSFYLALMAILVFSLKLDLFPPSDMMSVYDRFDFLDRLKHLVLPASVLAVGLIANKSRYMRSSMLEVIKQDYVRTARAKGVSENKVIYKHALRNALLPIITILGFQLPALFGGSLFVENIFAWPGMGRLAVNAIFIRDYQVIMGTTMFAGVLVVMGNLLADILYAVVDPRIQYGKN